MITEMTQIQGIFGTKLPVLVVVLGGVMMSVVSVISLLPRFTRNAVWKGTHIPITFQSRVSGLVIGWIAVLLFVVVHPLALLAVLPVGLLTGTVCLRSDREKFARIRPP